jgi:hypothetical protein
LKNKKGLPEDSKANGIGQETALIVDLALNEIARTFAELVRLGSALVSSLFDYLDLLLCQAVQLVYKRINLLVSGDDLALV